jgi:creatinine amidohydrolase
MAEKKRYYYHHYTWPEIDEAVKQQPVVILPVGSVEDHGRHLPLDVDNFLIGSICEEAARRMEGEMLLLPPVPYGLEEHHMDFPGTINVGMEHLLNFVLDVTRSIARHGFDRILLADGHGSNMPVLDLVGRRTVLETEALCGAFIWPSLAREAIERIRESDRPGGMAHACELETSLYPYLDSDRVQMDKAQKEMGMPPSRFIWMDLMSASPVLTMDHWSRFSKSGVVGDPTVASKEKGSKIFEVVVEALMDLVREFKAYQRGVRQDMHRSKRPMP